MPSEQVKLLWVGDKVEDGILKPPRLVHHSQRIWRPRAKNEVWSDMPMKAFFATLLEQPRQTQQSLKHWGISVHRIWWNRHPPPPSTSQMALQSIKLNLLLCYFKYYNNLPPNPWVYCLVDFQDVCISKIPVALDHILGLYPRYSSLINSFDKHICLISPKSPCCMQDKSESRQSM